MKKLSIPNLFGIFVLVLATITVITITLVYHAKSEYNSEYITQAHVSIADSIAFQYNASQAHFIDMPEELPIIGNTMCAYVSNDTIFVQHWHNYPHQKGMFRYLHNY